MRPAIDSALFERAVREHHAGCFRAARHVADSDELALDAVQETYRRVLEGKLELASARDLGALLRCAAAREALMRVRSERARSRREAEVAMRRTERAEEHTLEGLELAGALERALAEVPSELRHALVLRFRSELTFAQVGDALGISEPSAHQRVQRGLANLRERLGKLGFAAAFPDLGASLARLRGPNVPAGLERTLLTLAPRAAWTSGALGTAFVALAGAALLALAATLVDAGPGDADSDDAETGAVSAVAPAEPVRAAARVAGTDDERTAVAAAPARDVTDRGATYEPQLPAGRIEGRIVDEFELPVAGVEVLASSVEREGKSAAAGGATRSAADGSFRIEVPVWVSTGQDYALLARTPALRQEAGVVRVPSGGAAPYQRVRLLADALDRPGTWELALTVRDREGRAVPKALARVSRIVRNSFGDAWSEVQVSAQADERGELILAGEGLGLRLLGIDARDADCAPWCERLETLQPGTTRREIVLERGLAIEGRIVDERGLPVGPERINRGWVALYATAHDRNQWYQAEVTEPGRFRIPALAREPHTLHFQHDGWSPFTLHEIEPGGEPLQLALKLRGDPTDRGNHDIEIHGAVFDAADGRPLELEALDVFGERLADDSPALRDGDFAPLFLKQLRAQVFQMELDPAAPAPPPPHTFVLTLDEPGRYLVCVRRAGYAPTYVGPFELGPRAVIGPLDVHLERGVTLRGQVRDAAGRALGGAWIAALGPGQASRAELAELEREIRSTAGRGLLPGMAVSSAADGRFEFSNLPRGHALALFALHAEFEPVRALEVDAAGPNALEIVLTRRRER
ncbi:MAG: sigma-70 family RNA polymerase sigma factor [Planctomycetes bacterium]|nr:sigma-70 family RNA polymerase sigma factor [Planctomycetota bacterium]